MTDRARIPSLMLLLGLATLLSPAGCVLHQFHPSEPLLSAQLRAAGQGVKEVRIRTADGWNLVGDLFVPPRAARGTVVLLHQRGGQASDWEALSQSLQQAGIAALAIDQRGAGRSTQGPESGGEAPWQTGGDIAAAIASLKGRGPIGLAGASYGANNVLIYAASHPTQVRGIALLSPGANYHGLDALAAARKYRGQVVIYHDRNDTIAGEGPLRIEALLQGRNHRLKLLPGSEHGTGLLDPAVIREITHFFVLRFK